MGLHWNKIKFRALRFSNTWGDAFEQAAQCVLADLYDPLTMPPVLLKAHLKLDATVDAAYQPSGGKKTKHPTPNAWASCSSCTNASPVCYR
jgi:hypothetical protein